EMTPEYAEKITGGLSRPRKMPCPGYSLPASACKIGQLLAQVRGSVCESCYAADTPDHIRARSKARYGGGYKRGNYAFANVRTPMARRLQSIRKARWVPAMVCLILRYAARSGYFRWHDSG